ncbi:hypothetical protein F4604DRAFT_1906112 [Suillus subluteus]|nr:hypothetical protein F4604DRAFT_1906112 [Suillus subluteus]
MSWSATSRTNLFLRFVVAMVTIGLVRVPTGGQLVLPMQSAEPPLSFRRCARSKRMRRVQHFAERVLLSSGSSSPGSSTDLGSLCVTVSYASVTKADLRTGAFWGLFKNYQNLTAITQQVNAYVSIPEPDYNSYPESVTRAAYGLIYQLDGYHPMSIVLNFQDYKFSPCVKGTDIVLQGDVWDVKARVQTYTDRFSVSGFDCTNSVCTTYQAFGSGA